MNKSLAAVPRWNDMVTNLPANCMALGSHFQPLELSMNPEWHPHVYPLSVFAHVWEHLTSGPAHSS